MSNHKSRKRKLNDTENQQEKVLENTENTITVSITSDLDKLPDISNPNTLILKFGKGRFNISNIRYFNEQNTFSNIQIIGSDTVLYNSKYSSLCIGNSNAEPNRNNVENNDILTNKNKKVKNDKNLETNFKTKVIISNITIEDGSVEGGIKITNCENIEISNCFFKYCVTGLFFFSTSNCTIKNCTFIDIVTSAIIFIDSDKNKNIKENNLIVDNCQFERCGSGKIVHDRSETLKQDDNKEKEVNTKISNRELELKKFEDEILSKYDIKNNDNNAQSDSTDYNLHDIKNSDSNTDINTNKTNTELHIEPTLLILDSYINSFKLVNCTFYNCFGHKLLLGANVKSPKFILTSNLLKTENFENAICTCSDNAICNKQWDLDVSSLLYSTVNRYTSDNNNSIFTISEQPNYTNFDINTASFTQPARKQAMAGTSTCEQQ